MKTKLVLAGIAVLALTAVGGAGAAGHAPLRSSELTRAGVPKAAHSLQVRQLAAQVRTSPAIQRVVRAGLLQARQALRASTAVGKLSQCITRATRLPVSS